MSVEQDAASRTSSGLTPRSSFGIGSAESARIAAPTGSVVPPVNFPTLFGSNRKPGVARP